MASTQRWRIEVTGMRQVFDALDETDKKAANLLRKEITKAAQGVATAASYYTPGQNPVSNWGAWMQAGRNRDASYDPAAAARGFKVRRSNFMQKKVATGIAWNVDQTNVGGSIYELMGTGNRVTTRSGESLVRVVSNRFPVRRPRSLFRAYYDVMTPQLRDQIRDRIVDAARKAGLV